MLPEVKEERQMDQKRSLISKCQKYKLKRERERELREFALILTPDLAVFSHIKASSEQSLNGFGAALLRGPKGAAEDTNLSAVTGGITVKV